MFTALLREKQLADLRGLSRKTGQSVSELIRQAVDGLLERPDRAAPRKQKGEAK